MGLPFMLLLPMYNVQQVHLHVFGSPESWFYLILVLKYATRIPGKGQENSVVHE